MEYIILESNGTDISFMDGALQNYISLGCKNGYVPNFANEVDIFSSGNTVTVDTGELIVQGFRIVLTEQFNYVESSAPSNPITFYIVGSLNVSQDETVSFSISVTSYPSIIQQNIFDLGFGTYSIILGSFKVNTNGTISDVRNNLIPLGKTEQISTIYSGYTRIANDLASGAFSQATINLSSPLLAGDRVKVYFKAEFDNPYNFGVVEFEVVEFAEGKISGAGLSTTAYASQHFLISAQVNNTASNSTNVITVIAYALDDVVQLAPASTRVVGVYKIERIRKL